MGMGFAIAVGMSQNVGGGGGGTALAAATLTRVTGATTYPPEIDFTRPVEWEDGDQAVMQRSQDATFATGVSEAIQTIYAATTTYDFGLSAVVSGSWFFRMAAWRGTRPASLTWSNFVNVGDVTAPVITGGGTTSSVSGGPVAINFTTDEGAYFSLTGTDAGLLEVSNTGPATSTTVRLASNANSNVLVKSTYAYTLVAADYAGNSATAAGTHTITAPPGVTAWNGTNGVNKNQYLTASNGNLTMLGNATVGAVAGVRAVAAGSGKCHFEVTIDQITNAIHVGVTDNSVALGSAVYPFIGTSSNAGATLRILVAGTFTIGRNNAATSSVTMPHGNIANGDVIVCEFDTAANTISWYQVRGGSALQVGSTQTLTSLIPAVWHAYGSCIPTGTTPRDKFTANFGGSPWAMLPTSGYGSYS